MSMGMGGGRGGRVAMRDESAQREANATAPRVPDLGKRILGLFAPHRGQITLTIALVLVVAAVSVFPPLLTQRVFDEALFPPEGGPDLRLLWTLVAVMVALWITASLLGIWQTWLTSRVGNRVMGELRNSLFDRLQGMELAFFTRTKTGVIQSRLQNDVGGVANVLSNTISSVVGNTVTVLSSLVTMLILSWELTIAAVLLTPLLVILQRRVGQVRARIATETQESLSEMTAITQESLSVSGILLAKVFGRQTDESRRYRDENDRQIGLQVRLTMSGQTFFALVSIFISILPAVIYVIAGYLITGGDVGVTAGTLVAFTTVQSRLLMPLMGLLRVALDLQTSSALFARIFEYLDLRPSIVPAAEPVQPDASRLGEVEFDAVEFRYPDAQASEPNTLDGVSFSLEPGTFAAFVGPSGAGKTTIGYLLPRLHEVTGGAVRFAGVDVREIDTSALTDNIGIVSQEPYLFHASIADNLRYAKPDATDAELDAATRAASIYDTIHRFADGYDTIVGERGYRLSGGEKQRIAIARVLLKDPAVLVLDEATSALDTVSERVVQAALDEAARGRTTLAIAHRLSTIRDADVIFVIDAGRIVERGTHDELLAQAGTYAALFAQQAAR
ncbi:ABC transporter ATP-binding protein [Agrococcus sp. Marseille-P2731]|uniref:ABC transporter ATP-binding protein n=1 Tax=Agrococcus sp. Marseille-P2731 TaxID=1841862 RepID=UPI00093180E2|nr:ABC transporter ATP-binding protein [Agrococcus sp. Marseille-P2731]